MTNVRIARGEYVLSIEKDGYAPIERTVSGVVMRASALTITPPPIRIDQRLLPAGAVPARMVFVPGGDYRLISWSRPTDRRVRLDDYYIDKYEVSNQEYKEFINGGGYVKREFWTHPFVKDGRTLPWEEAIRLLVDRTGLPGPRTWSNQSFPDGKAEHPVTDVTWYEAAAYAAFRGKRLATIFQWEKAARNGYHAGGRRRPHAVGGVLSGRSAQGSRELRTGTLPTTSAAFGMSAFGAYNMAGNVAEWTSNDSSDGYLATGGAWGDPLYMFSLFGGRPGFFSSEKIGFRCARAAAESAGDQGGQRIELDQGSAAVHGVVAAGVRDAGERRIGMRRRRWTRASSRQSRRPSGSERGSRSTVRTAPARSPTSICPTMRRGRSRSCTTCRPATSILGSDRCPIRWTTAWRHSSEAAGPCSVSCSKGIWSA